MKKMQGVLSIICIISLINPPYSFSSIHLAPVGVSESGLGKILKGALASRQKILKINPDNLFAHLEGDAGLVPRTFEKSLTYDGTLKLLMAVHADDPKVLNRRQFTRKEISNAKTQLRDFALSFDPYKCRELIRKASREQDYYPIVDELVKLALFPHVDGRLHLDSVDREFQNHISINYLDRFKDSRDFKLILAALLISYQRADLAEQIIGLSGPVDFSKKSKLLKDIANLFIETKDEDAITIALIEAVIVEAVIAYLYCGHGFEKCISDAVDIANRLSKKSPYSNTRTNVLKWREEAEEARRAYIDSETNTIRDALSSFFKDTPGVVKDIVISKVSDELSEFLNTTIIYPRICWVRCDISKPKVTRWGNNIAFDITVLKEGILPPYRRTVIIKKCKSANSKKVKIEVRDKESSELIFETNAADLPGSSLLMLRESVIAPYEEDEIKRVLTIVLGREPKNAELEPHLIKSGHAGSCTRTVLKIVEELAKRIDERKRTIENIQYEKSQEVNVIKTQFKAVIGENPSPLQIARIRGDIQTLIKNGFEPLAAVSGVITIYHSFINLTRRLPSYKEFGNIISEMQKRSVFDFARMAGEFARKAAGTYIHADHYVMSQHPKTSRKEHLNNVQVPKPSVSKGWADRQWKILNTALDNAFNGIRPDNRISSVSIVDIVDGIAKEMKKLFELVEINPYMKEIKWEVDGPERIGDDKITFCITIYDETGGEIVCIREVTIDEKSDMVVIDSKDEGILTFPRELFLANGEPLMLFPSVIDHIEYDVFIKYVKLGLELETLGNDKQRIAKAVWMWKDIERHITRKKEKRDVLHIAQEAVNKIDEDTFKKSKSDYEQKQVDLLILRQCENTFERTAEPADIENIKKAIHKLTTIIGVNPSVALTAAVDFQSDPANAQTKLNDMLERNKHDDDLVTNELAKASQAVMEHLDVPFASRQSILQRRAAATAH